MKRDDSVHAWHDFTMNLATNKVIKRRLTGKKTYEYGCLGRVFNTLGDAAMWSAKEGNAAMEAVVLEIILANGGGFFVYDHKGVMTTQISNGGDQARVRALEAAHKINRLTQQRGLATPEKIERRRQAYRESLKRVLVEREKERLLTERRRAFEAVKFADIDGSW